MKWRSPSLLLLAKDDSDSYTAYIIHTRFPNAFLLGGGGGGWRENCLCIAPDNISFPSKVLVVAKILHAPLNLITGKSAKRKHIALNSAAKITFLVLRWIYSVLKIL